MEDIYKQEIMVVDDSLTIRMQLKDLLEENGFQVRLAKNGKECIQMLEVKKPGVILLDIIMPEMSGIEVCKFIKTNDVLKDIPILILTSETDIENKVKGLNAGADDYVMKPFEIEELMARLRVIFRNKELEAKLRLSYEETKAAKKELEIKAKALEKASKHKSEFLANMSHEIRTPMNAILGMAELLTETPLNSEQKQYVQVFCSAGENLLTIINDILDLSKVEAGQLQLETIDFDLQELAETTCEIMAIKAQKKDIEIICHILPDVIVYRLGDPVRIRQIISNLIGNAIKFTDKGEIVLRIENAQDDMLLFTIRDTGIGIAKDKLGAIFESFVQAEVSTVRKYGGTGLGLNICQKLSEMMGGKIGVRSQLGKGSEFYFTAKIPVPQKIPKHPYAQAITLISSMRVIIMVYNNQLREVFVEIFKHWQTDVTETENVEDFENEIEKIKQENSFFHIVLFEYSGKNKNEIESIKKTSEAFPVGKTKILLMANSIKDIKEQCQNLNIASYIIKPLGKSKLLRAIGESINVINSHTSKMQQLVTKPQKENITILLVEDSSDNRMLIKVYLKKLPYKIEIAENGEIAVEKFISGNYSIVLMDMQMPVMDGYTATRKIREWEKNNNKPAKPIVALSAYALNEEREKALKAGCNTYLTKPIKKIKLLECIDKILNNI